jgi:transposase
MPKQYPRDLRERAVRLVLAHKGDYATEREAIGSIAAQLGRVNGDAAQVGSAG